MSLANEQINATTNSSPKLEEDLSESTGHSTHHLSSIYNSDQKNFSEDEFSDIDSLKIISKSPLARTNVLKSNPHHRPTTIIIGGNNNFEIKPSSMSSGSENGSLFLDTRIPNVLIESPISTQSHKSLQEMKNESAASTSEPVKRSVIIEVRPTLTSSTTAMVTTTSGDVEECQAWVMITFFL